MIMSNILKYVIAFNSLMGLLFSQQIDINRIELMPNIPQPYEMRDWKSVARGYDSLVFDLNAVGTYLPLTWIQTNTVNYPGNNSFGLHTVVGTPHTTNAEGINCIPALVGASLMGIDKSDQNNFDYVLGSQEWFNKRSSENVYLNNFSASSGSDWWYETMPNIFFYQLKDLYPDYGVSSQQFETVAQRWLEATVAMGGSTLPWRQGNFQHRAWSLSTMTPNDNGVKEPEAAGAIGWLLYMAYTQLGEDSLRLGAEWALEFLSSRSTNPAYELQLPYGAVIAARMNAELGTNYDVEKILNWCFDVTPLREWGATLGTWGGYDCDGLIGEAKYDGYAFAMNGFQQVSALAPLARYDDRFARALGKWILNAANASRLFYPNYLPPGNQDSEDWSYEFDPNSYIAHESMRETWNNTSPYATGDAISGGWGATNLALYGSSHVGYLGAVVDTTNVPGILQLDLLATDWFNAPAYPSYLYYNPHNTSEQVELLLPPGTHDIYELTSNQIVLNSVSGTAQLNIMEDSAWLIAIVPSAGLQTYDYETLLIDGVVVDYSAGIEANHPPRIKGFGSPTLEVATDAPVNFFCAAEDREDGQILSFNWYLNDSVLVSTGSSIQFNAPSDTGSYWVSCRVSDSMGLQDSTAIKLTVVERINHAPVIQSLKAIKPFLLPKSSSIINCLASDEDEDELIYLWAAPEGGSLSGTSGSSITWTAPDTPGEYLITCLVSDPYMARDSTAIYMVVTDSSTAELGFPKLFLPFTNTIADFSGFDHDVIFSGASYVADRGGHFNSALRFDGVNDRVQVSNAADLNFTNAISVSLWLNVEEFFGREAYPISHGNWENRWKISITEKKIRWTVKTSAGVKDLDSVTELALNTYYHVVTLYDGYNFEIYINGVLDQHTTFSGTINPTTVDLTIGQVLPGNTNYNFKGIIDDVRIYDQGLSSVEISNLYRIPTGVEDAGSVKLPEIFSLSPAYPNPFNPSTTISYALSEPSLVLATIHDIMGRTVAVLEQKYQNAGHYTMIWNGRDESNNNVSSGIYFCRLQAGDHSQSIKLIYLR